MSGANNHRTDDCMDAGGRVKQDARTENRSVYGIHEDSSTELTPQKWHMDVPLTDLRMESRKKTIFRGALEIIRWQLLANGKGLSVRRYMKDGCIAWL